VLGLLHAAGIDAAGKEDRGLLHAELYVSRPVEEVKRCPINRMISVASGINRFASNQLLAPRNAVNNLQPLELLAG
jgi:hypothetical protein